MIFIRKEHKCIKVKSFTSLKMILQRNKLLRKIRVRAELLGHQY